MGDRKASLVWEFLEQKPAGEWFAEEILRCLPTPYLLHPHLKKALFLRRLSSHLSSHLSSSLLSHDTLLCLELIEELDRSLGAPAPPPALPAAYCAVAAHLTLAQLRRAHAEAAEAEASFLEEAHWIWDCRVADLEESEARGMVGEGMREWRAAIKEAVSSAAAREVLLRQDTGRKAAEALREYLRVGVNEMRGPLLELVARAAGAEDDDACGAEEEDNAGGGGGGDDPDRSHGEGIAAAGQSGECSEGSVHVEAPAKELIQMAHPASATGTVGGPHVPETETNEREELAGQTGEVITDQASEQLTLPSSVEVNKVRGALKSSCEELQKAVLDPLPDALERAAVVQTSMVEGSANPSDACEGPSQTGLSVLGTSIQKDVQDAITERNAAEDHNGIPCPKVIHDDVMDSTARFHEGGEGSNECLSVISANSSKRTHLSTRSGGVSPYKLQEVSKFARRRKIRRWTPQEEDALREAVKKHGKGNWKFILQSYPGTFEDRTEIDLKDKWRNMTR